MHLASTHRRSMLRLAASGILLTSLAAPVLRAGTAQAATSRLAMKEITLNISTFAFPASIPAGLVKVTVVNDTRAEAEAGFGRAHQGVTNKQLISIINDNSEQSFARALRSITFIGGASSVQPGQRETVILNLTPGRYGVVNTDGKKPVYRFFTVTASGGSGQASGPSAAVPVQLKDFKFAGLPQHVAAGATTFKLINGSPQAHEMVIIKLLKGKTIQDVKKALSNPGPPPAWAQTVGGMDVMSSQTTAWLTLKLTPGSYAIVCFMPDMAKGGMPHAAEGMMAPLSVS